MFSPSISAVGGNLHTPSFSSGQFLFFSFFFLQKLGIDVADLAGLERWFFYGLMLCHEVVDVTK